jgi:hypothetical protein
LAGNVVTGTAKAPPRNSAGPVTDEIRRTGGTEGEQRNRIITSPDRHEPADRNRATVAPSVAVCEQVPPP